MREEQFDKLISSNVKAMLDAPVPIDLDKSWAEIEKKLKEKESEGKEPIKKASHFNSRKLAMVSAVLFIITIPVMLFSKEVIGFRYEFYKWFSSGGGETVITEKTNPNIKEGRYSDLTFESAKALAVYPLKFPNYLPKDYANISPKITAIVSGDKRTLVSMVFNNNTGFIGFKQENVIDVDNKNTYLPDNSTIETIKIKGSLDATKIVNGATTIIVWKESAINYELLTSGISFEEISKILENIE